MSEDTKGEKWESEKEGGETFKDTLIKQGIGLSLLLIVGVIVWAITIVVRDITHQEPTPIVEVRMKEISRQEIKWNAKRYPLLVFRDRETGKEYLLAQFGTTVIIELGENKQ
jgi:hypothetical protein